MDYTTLHHDQLKQDLLQALRVWIRQRPGLDFGNYGDITVYRAELRQILKDLHQAERLLRSVELSGISGEDLLKAFRAYSGRMTWEQDSKGRYVLRYCTGQYWPTEYRRVVCAIAAEALWDYKRHYCMPMATMQKNEHGDTVETYNGYSAGDWLRSTFRREYGRAIQTRWFD